MQNYKTQFARDIKNQNKNKEIGNLLLNLRSEIL